jgi:hypothetical protein
LIFQVDRTLIARPGQFETVRSWPGTSADLRFGTDSPCDPGPANGHSFDDCSGDDIIDGRAYRDSIGLNKLFW